jgi:hypothetical protein
MKAKVIINNQDLLDKGGYVDPTSTFHWSGPGWYGLDYNYEWVKVSSKGKKEGFTIEEAGRTDYYGSPAYISSFADLERAR